MNRWEIILGIVFGLIVNEITDVSPWLARRLVRWSAYRWTTDPELAAGYAEEWAAVVEERPGKLFKLLTASRFAIGAISRATPRAFRTARTSFARLARTGIYLAFGDPFFQALKVLTSKDLKEQLLLEGPGQSEGPIARAFDLVLFKAFVKLVDQDLFYRLIQRPLAKLLEQYDGSHLPGHGDGPEGP
ncbi:hypothetical protein [Micromonospora sagamiensis]|uniref:Uncharacterized protein n=1 Tax=Micromonospora sagamiensis TaxID=47875 RepID=A0A562WKU0_9ACTN|nr:hypothetical protein [Micromonospora sagamiensis]TWJ30913.1 hypothetical protein JD81_04462 [Micromonospora sagamiensis]BCL16048.1 hypothetical protein GCM10017556_37870 [Micromonospora sagamiensis]